MRLQRGLAVSGVLFGFGNLFGQTLPPVTVTTTITTPVTAVAVTVGAGGVAVGVAVTGATPEPITPITPVEPPRAPTADARITNLSTRARVTGASPLLTGFAIRGDTPRDILVRAAGPALTAFGLSGTLAAPQLRLHGADGTVIAENSGWGGTATLTNAFATAGAFPFAPNSADAALLVTLPPGSYTAEILAGSGNGGVALVEVYDVDGTAAGSQLINVSARGTVAANGGELISGFVISGTAPASFLMRGVGPALAKFGVTDTLIDPLLTVFNAVGRPIATNDDWNGPTKQEAGVYYVSTATAVGPVVTAVPGGAVATAAATVDPVTLATQTTGAFALDSKSFDAALVTTLAPGAYTLQVSGNSLRVVTPLPPATVPAGTAQSSGTPVSITLVPPTSGTALIEIYQLP